MNDPAWKSKPAWILLLIVAAVSLFIDLASKSLAFRHIADAPGGREPRAGAADRPPERADPAARARGGRAAACWTSRWC